MNNSKVKQDGGDAMGSKECFSYVKTWCLVTVIAVISFLVVGCATMPPKTYNMGETVTLEGTSFELRTARYTSSYSNFVNQYTYANDTFLIVDVIATNLGKKPLPLHFQPVFRLIDSKGAEYEPSTQHTIAINMQKSGRGNYGQSWNPGVPVRQEIVFEVPKQNYKLRVLVPYIAQIGFAGSTKVSGRFFYYNLSDI